MSRDLEKEYEKAREKWGKIRRRMPWTILAIFLSTLAICALFFYIFRYEKEAECEQFCQWQNKSAVGHNRYGCVCK